MYISKEQFCKECHISKRIALWLIQNGLIPAINTQRQTNRYLISCDDVKNYLRERELHPQKYRYVRSVQPPETKPIDNPQRRKALKKIWDDVPDLLRLQETAQLLGYPEKRILQWRKSGELNSMAVSKTFYYPKKYLVDFVFSPTFHAISPKSPEHLDLLRRIEYAEL